MTPGFLSICFGVFLLLLAALAGLYVPRVAPEMSEQEALPTAAVRWELATPSPTLVAVTPSATPVPLPTKTPLPTAVAMQSPTPMAVVSPTATPIVHVVRAGETLSGIAERYGVSVEAIVRYNGLRDADRLAEGDRLTIPY